MTASIDWNATKERAEAMDCHQLRFAISDIMATLPHSDSMDRQDNGDRGGYYRDELSILKRELAKRKVFNREDS